MMNAFRAKTLIVNACGGAIGPVCEMPPDPPDETDDENYSFIRLKNKISNQNKK